MTADEPMETCWYCGKRPAEKDREMIADLYGNVRLTDMQTTATGYKYEQAYNKLKVPVPRCKKCESVHAVRHLLTGLFGFIPGLGVFGFFLFNRGGEWIGPIFGGMLAGLIVGGIGALVGMILGRIFTPWSIPAESRLQGYPPIKLLLSEGWKIGDKPGAGEAFQK